MHQLRQLRSAMPEQIGQLFICFGFFNRIQILTLDIFQQCNFKRFGIVKIAHDRRQIVQLNPLRRAAQPDELANVALFLASEQSSYINGQVLAVDGGFDSSGVGLPTLRRKD